MPENKLRPLSSKTESQTDEIQPEINEDKNASSTVESEDLNLQKRSGQVASKAKNTAEFIKSVGVIMAVVWAALTFVVVLLWEARIEPWLVERVKTQLEQPEHENWHRRQVLLALTDNRVEIVEDIEKQNLNKMIISDFNRAISPMEFERLFESEQFKELFLKQVLLAVSNQDASSVTEILKSYENKNLLEVWLNPPSVSILEGTVTSQVDAVYIYELFHTREAKWENDKPVKINGEQVYETRSQVSDRFYANTDQLITLEIKPKFTGRFRRTINSGAVQLYLEIGNEHRIPVNSNGNFSDVTCEVRKTLQGRDAGFVLIRATTETGEIPDGGYELDVIVTAKKGGFKC